MIKLETGHVVRLRNDLTQIGNVRFINRVEGRLYIDDPDYMALPDVVRVMWAELMRRDTDEQPKDLEVQVYDGRRLVWKLAC